MNRLVPLYREMAHGGQQFHGLSVLQHADQIGALIREHRVQSLIDFGCGRGDAYRSPHRVWDAWGLEWPAVTLYDPAFYQHDEKPRRPADMVICSDVVEHIPEDEVDAFVANLFSLSRRILWASVCCRPAKKTFPQTGENLHVTVKPLQWWQDTFNDHANGLPFVLVETP